MNRYKKLKFVGEGSFARVYKVIDKKTKEIMALKSIKKDGKSETEIEKLMEEIMILQSLEHENIIKIHEWFVTDSEICVITEFAEKGELFKIIKNKRKNYGTLTEYEVSQIAKQLISALQFLNEKRIIHRDIKPQNILLSSNNIIKLCDFGFARALSKESVMATSIKGTPLYMAPELVQEKPYNHNVDLWSLGIILYELYYGKPPFYTNSIYKLVKMIVKDHIKYPLQPKISKEFQHFINGLLQKKPHKRFPIQHLHKHPFLNINPPLNHNNNNNNNTYSNTYLQQIKKIKDIDEQKDIETKIENQENISNISNTKYSSLSSTSDGDEIKSQQSNTASSSSSSTVPSTTPCNNNNNGDINKTNNDINNVKQKVLDILDSNDWSMIDKILIILPQRWHSLCSISQFAKTDKTDMTFEINLFKKLFHAFKHHIDNNQNQEMLKNVINVMYLTMDRIFNNRNDDDTSNITQNTINYIEKYMQSNAKSRTTSELFPTLIKLIKYIMHSNHSLNIGAGFILIIISHYTHFLRHFVSNHHVKKLRCQVTKNVIDIVCDLLYNHPLSYFVKHYPSLKSFSKESIEKIPLYAFWKSIEQKLLENNQVNIIIENVINQQSKNTPKFLLFLLMTSAKIRENINNDIVTKKMLILYIYDNYLDENNDENEQHLYGLLLFYYLDNALNCFVSNDNEIRNIRGTLNKFANSSNIYMSNLSKAILISNHEYLLSDFKIEWQNILTFTKPDRDFNCLLFKMPFDANDKNYRTLFGKTIFDFWCHTLNSFDINENIKLSITICLQLFNILTKKIENVIKTNTSRIMDNDDNNNNNINIISAKNLNIFLKFLYKILKILTSSDSICHTLRISKDQKIQLIKEFLSKNHIQTLSILGNPQFILQYISITPFYIDTLYNDLIECCNNSYSNILLLYRYILSQYSKHSKSHSLLSPSPAMTKFKSFTNHQHHHYNKIDFNNNDKNTKNKIDKTLIFNFHKITLEFQLISSILNYIQISPPKQKEESCNLLFYVTWKQSEFMKEFLNNNGLLIITNSIIKQRKYHNKNIIIQVLQIITCIARKYKQFYDKIENTGIFTLIPQLLIINDNNDPQTIEIKEKTCNLIGNLCKHSDKFLNTIQEQNLLSLLCQCSLNKSSTNIRRFSCYAIGNIAYQSSKDNNNNNLDENYLIICIKPLSLRLQDSDYKTQENAAGAIGNLVSNNNNNNNNKKRNNQLIINEIINNNVIKLLLNQIRINNHLCVIRNCLYSLSNICYFDKCKKSMINYGWRHILKNCLDKYGNKDEFVKKCAFKILRKMESTKHY